MALSEEDKLWITQRLNEATGRLVTLMTQVKESLERDTGELKETVNRMAARLDGKAAR